MRMAIGVSAIMRAALKRRRRFTLGHREWATLREAEPSRRVSEMRKVRRWRKKYLWDRLKREESRRRGLDLSGGGSGIRS